MTSSFVLEFNCDKDPNTGLDFGIRTKQVNLTQMVQLDPNRKKAYRILRATISPVTVNVYKYNNFDNTTVNISNDGGVTWTTVQFKNGNYSTLLMLQNGINDVANQLGWYKSTSDPGIIINSNDATQYAYVKLDSSKLALAGQLAIDFSVSQMYKLLGFNLATCTFLVDGIHTGDNPPSVDTQGTYVRIYCSLVQNSRWRDGKLDASLCKIPFVTGGNEIEIIYPGTNTGTISPIIPASIPSIINSFTVSFKNANGDDYVWGYGNVSLELEILDI